MIERDKIQLIVVIIGYYIILNLCYPLVIIPAFGYMGFDSNPNILNIILSLFIAIFFTFLGINLKNGLFESIWYICLMFLLFPNLIYFCQSSGFFPPVLGYMVFLSILLIFNKLKVPGIKVPKLELLESKNTFNLLLFLSIILTLPYLTFIRFISSDNLLLKNIYVTREMFRNLDYPTAIGYLTMPLARVLLPFLLVVSLIKKNKFHTLVIIILILFIFLASGAVKSIFFGVICVLVFYFVENYRGKIYLFTFGCGFFSVLGILEYYILNSTILTDLFIRRIFFTPPRLEAVYYSFFNDNFTFYSHTFLRFLIEYPYELNLSRYIGEIIMGNPGSNANVGVIVDGYISLGWFGVLLHSIIISFFLKFLAQLDIPSKFFGIVFIYIYLLNTAFIGPFMITHGFLFFIVLSILIFKADDQGST